MAQETQDKRQKVEGGINNNHPQFPGAAVLENMTNLTLQESLSNCSEEVKPVVPKAELIKTENVATASSTPSSLVTESEASSLNSDAPQCLPVPRAYRNRSGKKSLNTKKKTLKKKAAKSSKKDASLEMTWICTECQQPECTTHPDSPLLVCEGRCNRPFHYPCAGLATLPRDDEKWICQDCLQSSQKCAVCHVYGKDGEEVFKCDKDYCGLFFHESCLGMIDNVDYLGDGNKPLAPNKGATVTDEPSSEGVKAPRFVCPAHNCWTCSGGIPPDGKSEDNQASNKKGRGKKRKCNHWNKVFGEKPGRLIRCLECPISYHISCLPPSSKFHELAMLCHEHAKSSQLPPLDASSSLQAAVEEKADKAFERLFQTKVDRDFVRKKLKAGHAEGSNSFFGGLRGNLVTPLQKNMEELFSDTIYSSKRTLPAGNLLNFCLPCDIKKEVHSKPPEYKHLRRNKYDQKHRPKLHPPSDEVCQCEGNCDENCMNRIFGIECCGDIREGKKSYWNCNNGPNCGNRMLSAEKFPKVKPKREQGKGWGLTTVNGIKTGGLVEEYTGEIIDEKTKRERLEEWTREHPNDPNYYIMHLETGWYIDARLSGSLSRFINHSCGPNCKLVPVKVKGLTRVAIVAINDIAPGEFLSYDYQFDTRDAEKFICRCGAPNCRGTMKGGSNGGLQKDSENEENLTKKDLLKIAKATLERDRKYLEQIEIDETERLFQVGAAVPRNGNDLQNSHLISTGPISKDITDARRSHVFLPRNARLGSNFSARYSKMRRIKVSRDGLKRQIECDVLSLFKTSSQNK